MRENVMIEIETGMWSDEYIYELLEECNVRIDRAIEELCLSIYTDIMFCVHCSYDSYDLDICQKCYDLIEEYMKDRLFHIARNEYMALCSLIEIIEKNTEKIFCYRLKFFNSLYNIYWHNFCNRIKYVLSNYKEKCKNVLVFVNNYNDCIEYQIRQIKNKSKYILYICDNNGKAMDINVLKQLHVSVKEREFYIKRLYCFIGALYVFLFNHGHSWIKEGFLNV